MSTVHESEFPFQELRMPTGDFYDNRTQMEHAGFIKAQMWSVVEAASDDNAEYLIYGPVDHYVNLLGYVATAEHHDEDTYYEECIKTAQEAAEEAAYYCKSCDD
jgi:hypothetical protein